MVTGKPRWPNLGSSQDAPAGCSGRLQLLHSSSVEKAGPSAVSLGSGGPRLGHGEAPVAEFGLQYASMAAWAGSSCSDGLQCSSLAVNASKPSW